MTLGEAKAKLSTFRFPTEIRWGAGARSALADFAARHNVHRPLLVTDSGLPETEAFRLITAAAQRVWPGAWAPFTGVQPNPIAEDVDAAYEAYCRGACDGIIGAGGGSGMDAAKALRVKIAAPDCSVVDVQLDTLPERLAPMVAIPTTAGTGSEVGRSAVITDQKRKAKVVLGAAPMMAELAILDPELTVGLPPHLTAATGLDALTHAIESFVCPMFHPLCDAIALEAIRLVRQFLPTAHTDPGDLTARGRMLIAASMGAVAFQKDLGAAHSLAHPLSTEFGIHHGLANAVVLPVTIRFNGQTHAASYARVAAALGLPAAGNPAQCVADFLVEFNRQLGIDQTLGDLGVPRERLAGLAGSAMADVCHQTNVRPCTEADMLAMYEEAWS